MHRKSEVRTVFITLIRFSHETFLDDKNGCRIRKRSLWNGVSKFVPSRKVGSLQNLPFLLLLTRIYLNKSSPFTSSYDLFPLFSHLHLGSLFPCTLSHSISYFMFTSILFLDVFFSVSFHLCFDRPSFSILEIPFACLLLMPRLLSF